MLISKFAAVGTKGGGICLDCQYFQFPLGSDSVTTGTEASVRVKHDTVILTLQIDYMVFSGRLPDL